MTIHVSSPLYLSLTPQADKNGPFREITDFLLKVSHKVNR